MSRRQQWRDAVRAAAFPVGLRPVKATLLSLPIDADGRLTAWREHIVEATGLPMRTVGRHLARACNAGWLSHDVRGGYGRRSTYTVHFPTEVVGHLWRTTIPSCRPRSTDNSPEVVGHVVAHSIKDRASVSEHLAVEQSRTPDDDQRNDRAAGDSGQTQKLRDGEAPRDSALAAGLKSQRGQDSSRGLTAGERDAREARKESVTEPRWESPEPEPVRIAGNPCCQECGLPRLYAPASIKLGVCANCVQVLTDLGEPPGRGRGSATL